MLFVVLSLWTVGEAAIAVRDTTLLNLVFCCRSCSVDLNGHGWHYG
jgi:hypothetical protein